MNTTGSILLVFMVAFLWGCQSSILIERSESLITRTEAAPVKVVCIDPQYVWDDDEELSDLEDISEITSQLREGVVQYSKDVGIDLDLYYLNDESNSGYFYDLLKLKKNMISANFNQRTHLNFHNNNEGSENIQKKVFVYPPLISHDFSDFSEKYGTQYFSYLGLYQEDKNLILYHIVVDTDLAETIYREIKVVKADGDNKKLMAQLIYDSYFMLKEEFS